MSHMLATSNCFWPTGCADMGRCNAEGFCIAHWQAKHKQEIWPVKHGGVAPKNERDEKARAEETAICMGFDAMRICLNMDPLRFKHDEIISWMNSLRRDRSL